MTMKVSIMISIFFVVILCHAAVAVEQFDLLPCTEGDGSGMLYCIEYDSMADRCYPRDNITRTMSARLPIQVLTQIWHNQGEIVILTLSGEAINNGQELISSQDRDRWTIEFNFQRVNSNIGKLQLLLHITDVEYRDEQYFHVEIRAEDIIFATRKKIWIPVEVKSSESDNDHDGETITTDNPTEDPSAILQARIETLQNEKEVLQEEKMTAENASIHYQTKYHHCLETKDDLKGTMMPEGESKGRGELHLDITTLVFVILLLMVMAVLAWNVIMLKDFKFKTREVDGVTEGIDIHVPPDSSITFKDGSLGEDGLLIQKAFNLSAAPDNGQLLPFTQ